MKRILLFLVYAIAVVVIFTAGFIQGVRYELRRFKRVTRR